MTIVRSLVVVLFSYVFMVAFVVVTTAVAIKVLLPAGREEPRELPPAYLSANLISAVVAALLGGWVAGSFGSQPLANGFELAFVVAVMGVASMRRKTNTEQPRWYALLLAWGMPVLVLVGAWLRTLWEARQQG
jgi:cytochrome bd-type quinol oxidase subunit 1